MDAVIGLTDSTGLNVEEWVSAGEKWGGAGFFFSFYVFSGDIIVIPAALGGDLWPLRVQIWVFEGEMRAFGLYERPWDRTGLD